MCSLSVSSHWFLLLEGLVRGGKDTEAIVGLIPNFGRVTKENNK
jgi:hypothetical protein